VHKHQSERKVSQGDSPSLVKPLIAISVSTENGRSWLPAFPRNCKRTKRKGKQKKKKKKLIKKKKNFQILDESQKAMYSVNVVS
jgi:hypothetical protein